MWDTEVSPWEGLSFRWRALLWRMGDVLEALGYASLVAAKSIGSFGTRAWLGM